MVDRRRTLFGIWLDFNKKVIPRDASDVQRREMKAAFYAGIRGFLSEMTREGTLAPGDDVTEDDEKWMLAIEKELSDFHDEYMRSRGIMPYTPNTKN